MRCKYSVARLTGPDTLLRDRTYVQHWRVHKFGGSSVADAACMERVARILESDPHARLGVVLSACRGVTDALLDLVTLAEKQDAVVPERLEAVRKRHVVIAETLLDDAVRSEYLAELDQDRRSDLIERLAQGEQVMMTTTDLDLFPTELVQRATLWQIQAGRLQGVRSGA